MWEPFQWPRGSTPPDRIIRSPPTLYRMSDNRLHKPLPASDRPEHYCLKWNNHSSNLVNSLCDQLYITQGLEGAPFADVTIVCDDGVRLHAHRVILAASSSNFYDIFKSTSDQSSSNNSHSFVILKDIESSDMKTLLEYMYKGEVTVAQNQLDGLITLAKSLQVRGLTGDTAEKTKPNFSDRSNIRDTDTDMHPHELTVSKRWGEKKALKAVADTTKASLSSETKVYSSPLESKFSLSISECLKEKLRSRSSTPVSRSHSPSLGHNYLKEEIVVKYESDTVKTEPDNRSSTHSHPARSRSPSTCPTSPTYPKQSIEMNRDTFQSLQQSYRSNSPLLPHQHRISLENSKHLIDYSRNALFMDQQLHHSINKPLAPSPYSDDEMFQRDISPPPSLYQAAGSALNLKVPHSTTSPPSPSSPSKRKRFPSSLLPSGVPPPSLLPSSHAHYPAGLQLGNFGLTPFPMFPMAYPHLDNLIAKSSYPDVTLRGLSVKKDLGMTEDDKPTSVKRQKLMENGPGFKDFDVNNYLKMSSRPESFRRHSPSTGHNQFDKRSDESSPTSTSNLAASKSNTAHSSQHPAFSSNNNTATNSSTHHNSSASIHSNNTDSPYLHHPRADSFTTNGPGGGSVSAGAGASANSTGNSNGSSSASHGNTNGGSANSSFNGQFVNYVGGPKPEWKRYKQYSKSDLMMAIDEVKSGMTALQASRKYKVPSRTLYDKIKKLGISTTPRRNITTGASNNKLRNHHVKSDYNIHGISVDRQDGGVGDHSDSVVLGGRSGGGMVSETDVVNSPMTSCLAGSLLKVDSLMRYDSSRPHSVESSATNDSFHPLDLQVSKATASEITAKLTSASASAAELYSKFPIFKSHVEQLNRYQMESGNRYPHELNSDSRLHHPFAPKSILDMLPRQVDAPASESLRSALTDNDPSNLSIRYEYLDQIRAHMGLLQSQAMRRVKGNGDSHEPSQSNNLDRRQHSNDENHHEGNETDDDSEIVVDNPDEHEKKSDSPTEVKGNDLIADKTVKSEFCSRSPYVSGGRNDNDTAYISHSTSAATGPSSTDSPPSSSFNMADSGHDSNNDTSTTSDNEGRHQSLGGIKIKHPKSSSEIICAMTSRLSDASPKASETSISESDVSPIISDKGQISLDSDSEIGEINSKTTTGSYEVVSDIGLCSQVRPLDLRETSVAMSIPQESV